jgi:undecaprenyl pyrophosphate phosphatase UppP
MTRSVRAVALAAAVYGIAGVVFGALAGRAGSEQMVRAWRLAAWLVSFAAFGAHIAYAQIRQRSSPRMTAVYVASAAAIGAFLLAVAANVHSLMVSAREHAGALKLSLVVWPVITWLPAFVVALVAAMVLARARRRTTAL